VDFSDMNVFARSVEAGSFSEAARSLGMSKATVSRAIARLERRIGVRLLQRTTRTQGLTEAGRVYYERCAAILAEVEDAERAVTDLQTAPRGTLRLSVPPEMELVDAIVREYLRRHDQMNVDVVATERRVDLVTEGFDVAIRSGTLEDTSLVARSLGTLTRVLCASPAYLDRRGMPDVPASLCEHECIQHTDAGRTTNWTLHRHGDTTEVSVHGRIRVNTNALVRQAAIADLGIGAVPEFVASADLSAGRLKTVLTSWRLDGTPLHAVFPSTRQLAAKSRAFIDLAVELLDPLGRAPGEG
jgi:DNA-binding transcriptional LysR family regulator